VRRAEHCPTAFPLNIADFGFSAPDASVPIRLALDDRLSLNENTSDRGHVAAKSVRSVCLCCGLLPSLLLTWPCIAHDSKHPEFDSWYKGLKNPNFKSAAIRDLGCCSARDCHETEADIRNGRWWARVGKLHTKYLGPKPATEAQHAFDYDEEISWELTEWKEVPAEAILKIPNPTGASFRTTNIKRD
jgi:hypothetical protein